MALTRKFLSALGIEADKIDEIISSHVETVDALKTELEKYKSAADKLAETEKSLKDVQKELKVLKEDKNSDEMQKKYNSLEKEFENYKKGIENEKILAMKEKAFRSILKEYGIPEKRFDAIIKLSHDEIDKIKIDKDGNLEEKDNVLKSIDDNWSDYKQTTGTVGANVSNPPAGNGGTSGSPISRAKLLAQKHNEELYGIKTKEE